MKIKMYIVIQDESPMGEYPEMQRLIHWNIEETLDLDINLFELSQLELAIAQKIIESKFMHAITNIKDDLAELKRK